MVFDLVDVSTIIIVFFSGFSGRHLLNSVAYVAALLVVVGIIFFVVAAIKVIFVVILVLTACLATFAVVFVLV